MPDTVLVAFDGSPLSERALTYALENFPDATITTLYVINPVDSVIDVEAGGLPVAEDWYDDAQERATRVHTTATELAAEQGIELDTVTEVGRPVVRSSNTPTITGSTRSCWVATDGQESTGCSSGVSPRRSLAEHGFR